MNKKLKALALFAIPHSFVMIFCNLMIFFGIVSLSINGFGVDTQGELYVAEGKEICIYQNGVQVRTIRLRSDTYAFTMESDDVLIVAYPSAVDRMDKTGNVLESWKDSSSVTYQQIQNNSKTVVTFGGDEYRKVSELGWTRIVKNGTEVVYKISVLSFVVKLLLYICIVSLFANGTWLVFHLHKNT